MRPEEHFLSVITDPITVRSPLSLISTRYPPRSHFKFRTLDSNPTSTGYEMLPLIYFKGQVSIRTNSKCLSRYIVLRYSVPFFVRTELSYLSRGVSHQLIQTLQFSSVLGFRCNVLPQHVTPGTHYSTVFFFFSMYSL